MVLEEDLLWYFIDISKKKILSLYLSQRIIYLIGEYLLLLLAYNIQVPCCTIIVHNWLYQKAWNITLRIYMTIQGIYKQAAVEYLSFRQLAQD